MEKIKLMVMGAFIFYVITIIGLIVYTNSKNIDSFYIEKNEVYETKLLSYKQKLSNMENNICNNSIKDIIDYYEKTDFEGDIKYSAYYKEMMDNDSFLSYFSKVRVSCNLSDEIIDKYDLETLFISSSNQFDEILQNYYYNYELNLKDIAYRNATEINLVKYEYLSNRSSILTIISNLIEISSKDGDKNEE